MLGMVEAAGLAMDDIHEEFKQNLQTTADDLRVFPFSPSPPLIFSTLVSHPHSYVIIDCLRGLSGGRPTGAC
jgi:hypothetical protein